MGSINQNLVLLALALAALAIAPAISHARLSLAPQDCWNNIDKVDGCQKEIFSSYGKTEGDIHIFSSCCKAILDTPRRCRLWILGGRRFDPEFAAGVLQFCGATRAVPSPMYNVR